ncbi:atrial natriuretic peptide receptor 1 isoform X1 [Drosophila sulfurigaster albostrigata]|uniref:atrial natriuretic peptide receptor 1 isoform X1 n=1 Tax=Drosophila sulfurigaster albostrigata TaxID=89887 RepID=UPI002D21DDF2|nr:atrial natriuretic peptide receptor 1 isoform X1 [Drosophila sulfurigaster albostrigata]XP_062126283.1 atrial natriuretic peptide receptor 1 isoform X1 [Drosophila sulfurigaster albostrigata]XP_062126284.1 atrial natriuretic peptide receptor 1 isoform X1 [Drosophila sulfurigaster albostrigata]
MSINIVRQPSKRHVHHLPKLLLLVLLILVPSQRAGPTPAFSWFYDVGSDGGLASISDISGVHSFKVPNTRNAQKSAQTQLVQNFPSPINHNSLRHGSHQVRRQLVFVALLPSVESDNKNDCIMPKVLPVLELGIAHVQRLGFVGGVQIDISLISRDTFCSSTYGPLGFFEIFTQWPEMNAIFGLPCEYVLAPISRYADVWQIPLLTTGGNAGEFSKKADSYSTLTRLKGAQVNNLGNMVRAILNTYNWTRTALIYQNENAKIKGNSVCFLCLAAIHDTIEKESVYQLGFDTAHWTKTYITRLLRNVAMRTRIVIMCADPQSIRQIMLTAEELNMIDSGEYVFINIELFSRVPYMTSLPWYDKNDTDFNNERAKKAYTAMLTVTPKQPNDDAYTKVSNEIKDIASAKYNYTFSENEPISAFVTSFFDGVLLYANALNESIREDPNMLTRPINGTDIVRRMWNRSFTGITGNVTIDSNGDRISAYSLLDMNPDTGRFEIVAHFLHNRLEFESEKEIHWAGGREQAPPDRPICGYDGSLCPDNSLPGYAILSIILATLIIIMAVCFFFGYRHYIAEAEINSMSWKVSLEDVMFRDSADHGMRGSFHSLVKQSSQLTLMSEDMVSINGDRQIFIPVGMYRKSKVAIKSIEVQNVQTVLSRSLMLELKRMKDLQHDHLVKFYGACLDQRRSFLLTEYCPKGSLQDILENEQFQLDWMFKLSLMHDIVRGMQFLHSSDIRSHGNLKSSNCVVDSRFVLKITDFGLHSLRRTHNDVESDIENCNSHAYWRKLLWTAPELLRLESHRAPEGTQKGDVYSFGIIVHEITTRQGPFYLGNCVHKTPQEIVELVKTYQGQAMQGKPFRPELQQCGDTKADVIGIIKRCWAEDPVERPDFNTLKSMIRKFNKDNETGNIVDNLLKRMEMYANNLEELVEERTQDYLEEKKKCEKLLYQLLPQSVAAQLISGQPVVAETFDQVTIYFSDIVGFTAISAESTPMQVVQFLNDLYTCFDSIVENFDVYKVETIGDAYMVVSGLPIRNENYHAREIARLALALLEAVHNFRIHHRPSDRLKLRIGLHTGPCVAGVVGQKMPRYCLFGDTVNTASRMESNGEALKIHISETTKLALDEFGSFVTTRRGLVPMKGKGEMLTYWLEGEMPNPMPDSLISPKKLMLTRRSSLKQPQHQSHAFYKQYSELGVVTSLAPAVPTLALPSVDKETSPNLRVKRKISSSSPKLNGNCFDHNAQQKTEENNYYLDAGQHQHPYDIYSSRSLRSVEAEGHGNSNESTRENGNGVPTTTSDSWELAHFRLPLSGTLKSHTHSHILHGHHAQSTSSSNLSGILQPTPQTKNRLKPSPTISTLLRTSRSDTAATETGSTGSGQRIKFADCDETPLLSNKVPSLPTAATVVSLDRSGSSCSNQNIPGLSGDNPYGYLVKNYKQFLSKATPVSNNHGHGSGHGHGHGHRQDLSITEDFPRPPVVALGTGGNAVTQPLLAKINS